MRISNLGLKFDVKQFICTVTQHSQYAQYNLAVIRVHVPLTNREYSENKTPANITHLTVVSNQFNPGRFRQCPSF